jgi:hypothetical protein
LSGKNILTRRANQRHYSIITPLVNAHGPPDTALLRDRRQRIFTDNSSCTGSRTPNGRLRVANPRALPHP